MYWVQDWLIYQYQFEVHIYQVLFSKFSGKDEHPFLFFDSIFVRSTVKSSPKDEGENQLPLIGFTPGGRMMDTMSISTHSEDLVFLSILSVNLDPYSWFLFPLILLTKLLIVYFNTRQWLEKNPEYRREENTLCSFMKKLAIFENANSTVLFSMNVLTLPLLIK